MPQVGAALPYQAESSQENRTGRVIRIEAGRKDHGLRAQSPEEGPRLLVLTPGVGTTDLVLGAWKRQEPTASAGLKGVC